MTSVFRIRKVCNGVYARNSLTLRLRKWVWGRRLQTGDKEGDTLQLVVSHVVRGSPPHIVIYERTTAKKNYIPAHV
jgi:hypothetical protein